jgi:DNA-binding NarL/FixJ family response regulator
VIRILLVDDHPIVREGLAAVLAAEPDFSVVDQAGTGEVALELARSHRPDVVVLDVRLPGLSGTETCAALLAERPRLRVVVLTSYANESTMLAAFSAGARGFLMKESDPSVLRQAVRTVTSGGTYIDPRLAGRLVTLATKGRRAHGPFGLTLQEMRVLELLPGGLTNRQLGRALGVSEETVKTHLHNAMRKLGAKDRAQVAAIAIREGLA